MLSKGFNVSGEEVKIKIHNLTNKYKEEKRKIGPSGGSPSSWDFYDRVHSILGPFKTYNMQALMDESIESQEASSNSDSIFQYEMEFLEDYELTPERNETLKRQKPNNDEAFEDSAGISTEVQVGKRKKTSFQMEVLKRVDESNCIIQNELEKYAETEKKMLKMQEEMVSIEKERNEILKTLLNN
ncbi:hypothetical protein FF38_12334 [Lucilia cuprina]|uniref:Myb/SANT-like DNA-binding domain-containing protein n=1 Tax=Lucilia cuprina TaxID=7375 RepID=A0A0L0C5E2_LUCCU|nr:hypothetical protein FF38_12334 [Lucilia cuprina]